VSAETNPPDSELITERLALSIDGADLEIATARRDGQGPPVVFLHGFGSTKEDYIDFLHHPAFAGRSFLAYDAPGCGETSCSDLSKLSIPFLMETARAVLSAQGIERLHLAGHSMGGLTALMLAHHEPDRVLSFLDIEGNLAPEDCFLSRQILTHPTDDAERFVADFVERTRHSIEYASALYASGVQHKVRPAAVHGIFSSMVELSDHGNLLAKFLALPCPRMFMCGEQNARLSYLPTLAANGVELAEIPQSGHWPMYSNPVAAWERIDRFLQAAGS
jgi:pimeloyl-ACP methyl ester carboxylesterase